MNYPREGERRLAERARVSRSTLRRWRQGPEFCAWIRDSLQVAILDYTDLTVDHMVALYRAGSLGPRDVIHAVDALVRNLPARDGHGVELCLRAVLRSFVLVPITSHPEDQDSTAQRVQLVISGESIEPRFMLGPDGIPPPRLDDCVRILPNPLPGCLRDALREISELASSPPTQRPAPSAGLGPHRPIGGGGLE